MSTKTGLNPFIITEFISETQVKVGTIISFLFLFLFKVFNAEIVIKFAEDPEFTKIMLQRIVKEVRYYLENDYESDAKREREFVETQLNKAEKELEYWEKQVPSDKLILSKIQRERFASQTVYTELRKQLELSKISEVKEIINFKILDQPFVPERRFKPKRSLICALTILTAGFLSIFILFFQQFVINLRGKSKLDSKI